MTQLVDYCKQLKLKTTVQIYEEVTYETKEQYLTELFRKEVESRYSARVKRLLKKAGFLSAKTLEGYVYDHITWPKSSSKAEILDLAFLEEHENVLMLGLWELGRHIWRQRWGYRLAPGEGKFAFSGQWIW